MSFYSAASGAQLAFQLFSKTAGGGRYYVTARTRLEESGTVSGWLGSWLVRPIAQSNKTRIRFVIKIHYWEWWGFGRGCKGRDRVGVVKGGCGVSGGGQRETEQTNVKEK